MIPLNIILADDHEDSLEVLKIFVEQHPDFKVVDTCNNGEELVEKVAKHKPDLVIADIKMPKLDGIEAMKKSMQFRHDLKFIFVSGYDDFAVEAFNISAVDYVVKPLEMARLYAALEKAKFIVNLNEKEIKGSKGSTKKLPFKFNGDMYYVPFKDIFFIEKIGKKCLIHTKEKTFATYERLSDLYQLLDDSFYLAHRSNIINMDNVFCIKQKYETYLAYFQNFNKYAHISRLKIKEARELISHN
ncbi:LytTR family DNA-binding domain-containing protein [Domibacillus sp. A3M-37]|uniref:LytR/AlgR family response regulator transcription factor n=1 Tax=Domibacillus TaxID=1433999 RepID=UPI0020B709D0|nr:LytTR family DNA-binding domain-containing protein [Domibacillus sp. A3M-37]MCP3762104.1 LytTR family DNA-binding domain-containing protein [Domibacillus sp. A3M-37]